MSKRKKWTALFMILVLFVTSFNVRNFTAITVRAEETLSLPTGEKTSGDLTWSIDANGKLIIEGEGNYASNPEWLKYANYIKTAVVSGSAITSTYRMFDGCSNLTELDLSNFDTSSVTDMTFMFYGCSSLSELDLSNFDTSKVTNMSYMFNGCSSLSTLDLSKFNTSNVTNMSYIFDGCSSLSELDLSNFDTSKVTDMSFMFYVCSSLSELDLSNFDTSNVTDMVSMFSECSSLSTLDLSKFNTSNVTNMNAMFKGCSRLSELDLSNFDTSKVTNMGAMFELCSSLSTLDLSKFNTSNVTTMSAMFNVCSSLSELDLSNFDTSKVTNMIYMFNGCSNLTSFKAPSNLTFAIEFPSKIWKNEFGEVCTGTAIGLENSMTYTKYNPNETYIIGILENINQDKSIITIDGKKYATDSVNLEKTNSLLKTERVIAALKNSEIISIDNLSNVVEPQIAFSLKDENLSLTYKDDGFNITEFDVVLSITSQLKEPYNKLNLTGEVEDITYRITLPINSLQFASTSNILEVKETISLKPSEMKELEHKIYIKDGYIPEKTSELLEMIVDLIHNDNTLQQKITISVTKIEDTNNNTNNNTNTGGYYPSWDSTGTGNTTPDSTPTTIPVTNGNNKIDVIVKVEDNKIIIEEIKTEDLDKLTDVTNTSTTIELDLTTIGKEVNSVTFSNQSLQEVLEKITDTNNSIETLYITLGTATIEIDSKTLASVMEQANGKDVELKVDNIEKSSLNTKQQSSLQNKNFHGAFRAYFESNHLRIGNFKGGKVTVKVPFQVPAGYDANKFSICHIAEDGFMTGYKTTYKDNSLYFVADHFSDFVILYNEEVEDSSTEEPKEETKKPIELDTRFQTMRLKSNKSTKTTNKLVWGKVKDADGYVVYGAKCNTKDKTYKMKKQVVIKDSKTTTWTDKDLKSGTYYKYYVKAYKLIDGKKVFIAQSKTIRVATTGNTYGNPTAVKVNATNIALNVGETFTIKAEEVIKDNKKMKQHSAIKFETSNKKVATVNKNGKITAKKKGTATIYVYAQNGIYTKVKVTVK